MPFGDLNTVIVTGHFVLPEGTDTPTPAAGSVTFEFPDQLGLILDPGSNLIVATKLIRAQLVNGFLSVVVPASNDPETTPKFVYKITVDIQGASGPKPNVFYAEIPYGVTTIDMADISPVQTFPNVYGYVLVADYNELVGRVGRLEANQPGGTTVTINGVPGPTFVLGAADFGAATTGAVATAQATANAAVPKAGATMLGPLVLAGDPGAPLEAAPQRYVDAHAAGFAVKNAPDSATTAALPACTYTNGTAGLGARLTANANGALPAQAGFPTSGPWIAGQGLLVKNQAAKEQNGSYVVIQSGTGGTPWILERATDSDSSAELAGGAYYSISPGGSLGGSAWTQSTPGSIVVGTTPLLFNQANPPFAIAAGQGIDVTGTTISVTAAVLASILAKAPIDDPTFLTKVTTPAVVFTGQPGATQPAKIAGGNTAKPTTGTWTFGAIVFGAEGTQAIGTAWVCYQAGTFGTSSPPLFKEIGADLASFALGLAKSYTDQKFLATPEIISSDPSIISFAPPVGGQMVMDVSALSIITPLVGRNTVDQSLPQSSIDPTNQPVTGLFVPVAANTLYKLELYVWYKASDLADLRLAWRPPTPTGWGGLWSINALSATIAAAATEGIVKMNGIGYGPTSFGIAGGAGVTTQLALHAHGIYFNTTTAGNLQLLAAQGTSHASTVTIGARSVLIATPIG